MVNFTVAVAVLFVCAGPAVLQSPPRDPARRAAVAPKTPQSESESVLLAKLAASPGDRAAARALAVQYGKQENLEKGLSPQAHEFMHWTRSFGEGTVARVLSQAIWRCEQNTPVGDALAALKAGGDSIEVAPNLYVTDQGKLVGVMALRDVAVADPAAIVETLMTRQPIAVKPEKARPTNSGIANTEIAIAISLI